MAMLKQTIEDVHKFQDEETGMFWQVMDHPGVEGNYLETSGTALFAYAVLKGVRLGYLPKRMAAWAEKAFYGTCDKYLSKNPDGSLQLGGICLVAGLGGKDHRDGSRETEAGTLAGLVYRTLSRWSYRSGLCLSLIHIFR